MNGEACPTVGTAVCFLIKTNMVTLEASNSTPGYTPQELETEIQTETRAGTLTAAASTGARKLQHPECPSAGGRVSKMWRDHTTEQYSATQGRDTGLYDNTDAPAKRREGDQTQKSNYCVIPTARNI